MDFVYLVEPVVSNYAVTGTTCIWSEHQKMYFSEYKWKLAILLLFHFCELSCDLADSELEKLLSLILLQKYFSRGKQ